jgi:hypothetical protein
MTDTASQGNAAKLLLTMTQRTAGLAEALANGIDHAQACTMPTIDGNIVNCNHPTFILGHLAIYPQKIMSALGAEPGDAAVPASYSELFEAGVDCKNDPENSIYPPFAEVLEHFQRAHKTAHDHLASLDDATIMSPIGGEGNERAAEFFGTSDAMALFMLHDHYMFHLGQLSTWRRCFGLGHAMG